MTAPRVYMVTPSGGEPYRVILRPAADGAAGWSAEIERGEARWSFELAPGAMAGLAWAGTRPLRWRWDAAAGRLVLGGVEHALTVETEAAHRLAVLGAGRRAAARVEEVRAPMPGLVLSVEVGEGQPVAAGQGIAIIEAMKMENEITAPAAGVTRGVAIRAGEAVEKGALLCRIEPPAGQAP